MGFYIVADADQITDADGLHLAALFSAMVFSEFAVAGGSATHGVFHINLRLLRIPFSGKVDDVIYMPGKFYSADSAKGALKNEYCATVLTTSSDKTIAFVQVAGLIARRIVCWLEAGDQVDKGKRYGLIRFGSRVDLYLPEETDIKVQPGQKVRAGESVLAYLN